MEQSLKQPQQKRKKLTLEDRLTSATLNSDAKEVEKILVTNKSARYCLVDVMKKVVNSPLNLELVFDRLYQFYLLKYSPTHPDSWFQRVEFTLTSGVVEMWSILFQQNSYKEEYLDIALKYITSPVFPIPQDELWMIFAGAVKTADVSLVESLLGRFNPILATYTPFYYGRERFLYKLAMLVQRIPGAGHIAARLRGPNVEQGGIDAKFHYLRGMIIHDGASPDDDVLPLLLHWKLPRNRPQLNLLATTAYNCHHSTGLKLLEYIYPTDTTNTEQLAWGIAQGYESLFTETVIKFRVKHKLDLLYNQGELLQQFFTTGDGTVELLHLLLEALGPYGRENFLRYVIPVTRRQNVVRDLSYNPELLFEFHRLDMLQHFMTAAMVRCILGADHVIELRESTPTYLALPEVRRLLTPVQREACEKYHIREHLNLGWELACAVVYGCLLPGDIMSGIIEGYLGVKKENPSESLLNPLTHHYYKLFKKLLLSRVDSRNEPPKLHVVPARVPRKRTSMKRRRQEEEEN